MDESNTVQNFQSGSRLLYWWSLFVAGALLLILGTPILLVAWLVSKPYLVYPWAIFGGRNWLRLGGMQVSVKGSEHLDPKQTYVFISNHRSYLDTATLLFRPEGRAAGKEVIIEGADSGVGIGFVHKAIDARM